MNAVSAAFLLVALYFFAWGVVELAAMVKGCLTLRKTQPGAGIRRQQLLLRSPLVPAVSVIAVPSDVSPQSRAFVRRLLDLEYAGFELVLVLNGPSEEDLDTWMSDFNLSLVVRGAPEDLPTAGIRGVYESVGALRLVVVEKERGTEADALNAGVNVASNPVVGLVSADSQFEQTFLLRLIQPMLEEPDTVVVCGAGACRPAPPLSAMLAAIESWRGWLAQSAARPDGNWTAPAGATFLIRRETIVEIGGFREDAPELIERLRATARGAAKPWRTVCVSATVNRPDTPATFGALRERVRRESSKPGHAFFETTALLAALAAWITGQVDSRVLAVLLLATAGTGIALSAAAVSLREMTGLEPPDPGMLCRLLSAAVVENLGYRQIRNVWVIAGSVKGASAENENRGRRLRAVRPRSFYPPVR
jgi:hypothetical protein